MAHGIFMHDAHLGRAFLFLDILAEYTWLSMTIMVTPCLWYVVENEVSVKFPQAPFARKRAEYCFESTVSEKKTH